MKVLLLGFATGIDQQYRGVDRSSFPQETKDKNSENRINDAYANLIENAFLNDNYPYLDDIELAEKVAQIYTKHNSNNFVYELVEIVYPFEDPQLKNNFLGFDIILKDEGFSSIIQYLFVSDANLNEGQQLLIKDYNDKLNRYRLFPNLQIAFSFFENYSFFLDKQLKLAIVGIYN